MKKFNVIVSSILLLAIAGHGGYRWARYEMLDVSTIIFGCIALSYLLNSITWGDYEGGKYSESDELDKHIKTQSARIGYYALMVLSAAVLFLSEGVTALNDIQNIPLAVVVGLTFIVAPITEFFYSRKFR
ncbi:hypothetical protein [Brevibacillus porteri]|uniref:DUF2178 domain-containing protein n=1 Tax=Brevibacillus porteri TaxID=2126350 RepID=A0ABX5FUG4_9BACL|nr:hypothetical protein [Brevibacillus porteri]MED1799719.1 hypothetical protein [Brevibacillus porteri]MED2131092.1 hypothetical protein [Brevibacillus porteri]MED2747103.1 hypothetical protein [Brevibacillus porteri]MED2816541.1 hypothetical protein [Brevibacillus porteri]MED2894190.1 hypothetical protein [Brevibacillus porteri]